ncbi:hypothetical protein [Nostoc sp. CALU 1950]
MSNQIDAVWSVAASRLRDAIAMGASYANHRVTQASRPCRFIFIGRL